MGGSIASRKETMKMLHLSLGWGTTSEYEMQLMCQHAWPKNPEHFSMSKNPEQYTMSKFKQSSWCHLLMWSCAYSQA